MYYFEIGASTFAFYHSSIFPSSFLAKESYQRLLLGLYICTIVLHYTHNRDSTSWSIASFSSSACAPSKAPGFSTYLKELFCSFKSKRLMSYLMNSKKYDSVNLLTIKSNYSEHSLFEFQRTILASVHTISCNLSTHSKNSFAFSSFINS